MLLALVASAQPEVWAAVTVSNLQVTNPTSAPRYVIAADAVDGNGLTNRHDINTRATMTFSTAGTYRLVFELLDPSNAVVGAGTVELGAIGASTTLTRSGSIQFDAAARLDPFTDYRAKVRVEQRFVTGPPLNRVIWLEQASRIEAQGKRYYHFPSTSSGDKAANVIAEISEVRFSPGKVYVLEDSEGRPDLFVPVDFDLLRYDGWSSSTPPLKDLSVRLDWELRRVADDGLVPLEEDSLTFVVDDVPGWEAGDFGVKFPAVTPAFRMLHVDPVGQLDPVNQEYYVTVRISHRDTLRYKEGNSDRTLDTVVYHFNGIIRFGTMSGQIGEFARELELVNPADHDGVMRIYIATDAGTLDGFPEHRFGGSVSEPVLGRLRSDGDFEMLADITNQIDVRGPAADVIAISGVGVERTSIRLSGDGARADLLVKLPAGCGYSRDPSDPLLRPEIDFLARELDGALKPTGTLVYSSLPPLYVNEESKPVWLETNSIEWSVASGEFRFPGAVPHSLHQPLFDDLDAIVHLLESPELARKASNDHAFRAVATVSDAAIKAGPTGGARLDADFTFGAGQFESHLPYGTFVQWTGVGAMAVRGDRIDPAVSRLRGVLDPRVPYAQHCRDAVDGCGATERRGTVRFSPAGGDLFFTADGGLHAEGTVRSGGAIGWGYLESAAVNVHRMQSSFQRTGFRMPGHFFSENLQAGVFGVAPSLVQLAGLDPGDRSVFEYPGSVAYSAGGGDYAGLNFRVSGADAGRQMRSRLGGSDSSAYTLKPNAKFYARYSGVSGIQDADGGLDPASGQLFGFDVEFDSFGLGWLSNRNVASRTDGSVSVPAPAGFTLPFEELRFSCLGAPTTSAPPEAGTSAELEYWNAPFEAYDLAFVTDEPCEPSAENLCLVLGMGMEARHVGLPLYGTVGFDQAGQIVTGGRCGVTSEFPLPARFAIDGPVRRAGEAPQRYRFTPVRAAYLNSESADGRPAGLERVGYWNFAGGLDVAFFENLDVHLQTGAEAGEGASLIRLTGGWEDGLGHSYFNVLRFDEEHRGFPDEAEIADVEDYHGSDAYLPRAQQHWLGLVDFDYPIRWSSGRRSFRSVGQETNEIGVVVAEHRVDYLSAEDLHIRFGVEANTSLPNISLSNVVFNAVDEGIGAAESLAEAVGEEAFGSIEAGIDGFADLLSDEADELVAGSVDVVLEGVVDDLFDRLRLLYTNPSGAGFDDVAELVAAYFSVAGAAAPEDGDGGGGAAPPVVPTVEQVMLNLFGTVDAPTGLVPEIDAGLERIVGGIDGLAGDAGSGGLIGLDGLGSRGNLAALMENLVGAFAPEFAAVTAGRAHELLIAEADPVFRDLAASFAELRRAIEQLRVRLGVDLADVDNPFGDDFLDQLRGLEQQFLDDLRSRVLAAAEEEVARYLEALVANVESIYPTPADAGAYLDGLEEEIKGRIRRELRERIATSDAIAGVQLALRNRLRVGHAAFREATDAVFAEVNAIVRRLISETAAGLDDRVRAGFTKLSEIVKTGRVAGHAHVCGDSLCELRLDALVQLGVPEDDPLEFDGYFRILQSRSDGPAGCTLPASLNGREAILGARNAPLQWLSPGLRADVEAQFGFGDRNGRLVPLGFGGTFEITDGVIGFEAAEITEAAGAVKFGLAEGSGGALSFGENYVALQGRVELSGSALEGGIYLGRSCSLAPVELIDPEAGALLGDVGSFTGGYVYGEGWAPIVDFGCAFRVSAGVGAGLFYFAEGPTYGGRMVLGASGEALCTVSIRGEISLVGVKTGDDFRFSGSGRLSGKAGKCPFCVRFNRTVRATYQGGEWDVDY